MKTITFSSLALIILAACSAPKGDKPPLKSGIVLANMDTTIKPGDNFQMFVNGAWIKNTEIPADKSSYGVGWIVHEQSQENIKKIIEESAAANKPAGTDEQKVGDLYASYMDTVKRNELGIKALAEELEKIDNIKNLNDLSAYFGYATIYGYGTPMQLFVDSDFKNPKVYTLFNYQGGLGLPDREYYSDKQFDGIRKAYVEHIGEMFELAGLSDGAASAQDIFTLEKAIAANHWKKEDTRDMNRMYNMLSIDSLDKVMTNFSWKLFLEGAQVTGVKRMVITQPSFTLALNDVIGKTKLETWKTYLKWSVLNSNAGLLNTALDKQNFKFYGAVLTGAKEQRPMWRRGVDLVNGNLGEVVGKVYVTRYFPAEAKARMNQLVSNLIGAYKASINELDWMGTETRIEALDKLAKFDPKIGYPDVWKDYSAVVIGKDNLVGNIRQAKVAEHLRQTKRIGGPVDRTEWGMNPQEVNAYYNPMKNEIVFPAGILQPPFFDLTADDAVNYGAIGAVIGHEIGHGFDDQGSTFNGDGELKNWWTDKDREEFKKRTQALVEQYNQFKVFADLNVNGEFTLGENIGDLGGLSIALKAYQISLNGKEAPVIEGYTGTQRVFLGWAQAWLGKSREEAARLQVSTDPHSPGQFRVNGVVRNIPEFYNAFNIKPGDTLYLAPEKRVKIW